MQSLSDDENDVVFLCEIKASESTLKGLKCVSHVKDKTDANIPTLENDNDSFIRTNVIQENVIQETDIQSRNFAENDHDYHDSNGSNSLEMKIAELESPLPVLEDTNFSSFSCKDMENEEQNSPSRLIIDEEVENNSEPCGLNTENEHTRLTPQYCNNESSSINNKEKHIVHQEKQPCENHISLSFADSSPFINECTVDGDTLEKNNDPGNEQYKLQEKNGLATYISPETSNKEYGEFNNDIYNLESSMECEPLYPELEDIRFPNISSHMERDQETMEFQNINTATNNDIPNTMSLVNSEYLKELNSELSSSNINGKTGRTMSDEDNILTGNHIQSITPSDTDDETITPSASTDTTDNERRKKIPKLRFRRGLLGNYPVHCSKNLARNCDRIQQSIHTKTCNFPIQYECHICFKIYVQKDLLIKHLKTHEDMCMKQRESYFHSAFKKKAKLKLPPCAHTTDIMTDLHSPCALCEYYVCSKCKRTYKQRGHYKKHMRTEHFTQLLGESKCKLCIDILRHKRILISPEPKHAKNCISKFF